MQPVRATYFLPVLLLAVVAPAMAQQPPAPGPTEGIYIAAFTGAAVRGQATPVFAGELGDRIHPNVEAYARFSYFDNLMNDSFRDDLAALSSDLTRITGIPWELKGRDRGVAFVAGARYLTSSTGLVRPYVGAGAGVINLRRRIVERQAGDITGAVFGEYSVGDSSLTTNSLVRPLVEGTAGVAFYAGRTYVDVGYRYHRAFQVGEGLDFSQLLVGIGVNF